MTEQGRQLLERLAAAGKATTLVGDVAKWLEAEELLLIVGNTTDAIITPRGRHKLASIEIDGRPRKPFGFSD